MDDRNAHTAAKAGPVFVSYATADRKQALAICTALEKRGERCWISCRDVKAGENYQEAIVGALRESCAVVLIFSAAANTSNEIKKEMSLASRYRKEVLALRIEDVEPSDAFAYELSTRQWIDAFSGREKAVATLADRLDDLAGKWKQDEVLAPRKSASQLRGPAWIAGPVILLVAALAAAWWWARPSGQLTHSMVIRLDNFRELSGSLPPSMPDTIREEIISAFGDDGVIRVSTAAAPQPGSGPAYLLGGTVRRDADKIRVITRLTNERSGATLWTDSFDYDSTQVARVPRRIAVDAGNMVHCGLFAASTYRKPLPDAAMSDYMQFCQNSWWSQQFSNPQKALDAARKVATELPDFSFGWSAITVAAQQVFFQTEPGARKEELRRTGIDAADKALQIDPKNSEALAQKSLLIGRSDWAGQEALLKRAIAARPLFCGCEHYLYGTLLRNVGRTADAVEEMRRSTDMLALDGISQFALADSLLVAGKPDEAAPVFQSASDLFRYPDSAQYLATLTAPETGDYAGGLKALANPKLNMPAARREAIKLGFRAMVNGGAGREAAISALLSLPDDQKKSLVVRLLGALGATGDALRLTERAAANEAFDASSWLWAPSMEAARNDPAFRGVVQRLGLVRYWQITRSQPDVCRQPRTPQFCAAI